LKLLNGTNADDLLHVLTGPDGDGVAPVSVAGEAPILGVDEPVVETFLLNEGGDPSAVLVVSDQLILDVCHLDEPGVEGTVDQGGV
jgi:hypothetical protein